MVVQEQAKMGKGLANPIDPHHTPTIIQPSPQPQKKQKPMKPKRKDTQIPQSSGPTAHVADEAVYKRLDDSLVRVATTASSLEVEQDNGNIPRNYFRGNILQSGENSLKLNELIELCTNLQTIVLDLEKTKTTQAKVIVSLKRRANKLEQKKRSRTDGLKRINSIDANEDITLVNDQDDADMFDVNTLAGEEVEVLAESEVAVKEVNLTVDEVTLAQALVALKSVKPKVKGDVIEYPSVPVSAASASTKVSTATTTTATISTPRKGIVIQEAGITTTTISSQQPSQAKVQDKGKGILVEPEKPMKKKDQISFDEETAKRLQAEFDEKERLAREKDEANVALTEE
ncbi:hypothetical protein Tco_1289506 [Tanacetum coccineum]